MRPGFVRSPSSRRASFAARGVQTVRGSDREAQRNAEIRASDEAAFGELMEFEPVIGLEVHAQLKTETKIFCGCSDRVRGGAQHPDLPGVPGPARRPAGAQPPGRRVRLAHGAGDRVHRGPRAAASPARTTSTPTCPRATRSRSTSCRSPSTAGSTSRSTARCAPVRIRRIHMEEDAGKLTHDPGPAASAASTSTARACR